MPKDSCNLFNATLQYLKASWTVPWNSVDLLSMQMSKFSVSCQQADVQIQCLLSMQVSKFNVSPQHAGVQIQCISPACRCPNSVYLLSTRCPNSMYLPSMQMSKFSVSPQHAGVQIQCISSACRCWIYSGMVMRLAALKCWCILTFPGS